MTEQTFRSPGFFEREIDLSARSKTIEGVPAGIIGTSQRGPAFVPVTIGSFLDFERKFGTLDPEMFGPYAVNSFLQKRTALTYVRVLGAGANSTTTDIQSTIAKGTVKNAGFRLSGSLAGTSNGVPGTIAGSGDRRDEGSVQFILGAHTIPATEVIGYPLFTDNNSFDTAANQTVSLVRGMVMMASGARLQVLNHDQQYSFAAAGNDHGKIQSYDGSSREGSFKLVLSSALGSKFGSDEGNKGIKILTASLDPTSNFYIGKILNTNPDRFKEEQHLLYGDFSVEREIARHAHSSTKYSVAIASGSQLSSSTSGDTSMYFREVFGSFNTRYQTAKTTSFISQPFGNTEYDLFHFESLDDGASGNRRVKISISNLRRSTDPRNPYGTFSVLVRDFTDTDVDIKILEQYNNCSLNPSDENYIANLIGDMKVSYNFDAESESERRVNIEGKKPNRSGLIRIVMNPAVENRQIPESTLPFGFRGLPIPKLNDAMIDDSTASKMLAGGADRSRIHYNDDTTVDSLHENANGKLNFALMPPVPMRFKATRGAVNGSPSFTGHPGSLELADSRMFWGVKFERLPLTGTLNKAALHSNASSTPNSLISSYSKFLGISKLDALHTGSGADAFCDNKFTLSKVALNNVADVATYSGLNSAIAQYITGTADSHMREAAYLRNKTPATPRYDVADGSTANRLTFASLVAGISGSIFNKFTNYLKFTNMMHGGFDGLNILDRDQRLMNDRASSSDTGGKAAGTVLSYEHLNAASDPGSGVDNNSVASYRAAARIISDPMASRVNIIAIPGIRDSFVTDYVSELTRDYSKAIYLMDIPAFDDDNTRLYDDSTKRSNVRKSVEQFEGRAIDNNYVATYFPDVIKNDPVNNQAVNMPASIAAVGALAHNDSVAYPWFAPAGFNRGALEDVLNTEIRLNTEDRNVLYEARINPIANFPNSGYVIFGQKTLQQARSALDRVNVRRMLLEVKRIVSDVANRIVFEQNTPSTRARFVAQVTPLLSVIQSQQGINQFKIVMDSSNNAQEDIEQNRLNGRIILVPTRAVEFIAMDFIITNSGVSFE